MSMVVHVLHLKVVFECMPNSLELVESFWRFSIPSLSLSTPFLLVANTVEPAINMDRAYLKFKSMLLGKLLCALKFYVPICGAKFNQVCDSLSFSCI